MIDINVSSLRAHETTKSHTNAAQAHGSQVLFLRGNAEIVRFLLHRGALERTSSTEKRRRGFMGGGGVDGGDDTRLQLTLSALLQQAHTAATALKSKAELAEANEDGDGEREEEGEGGGEEEGEEIDF